MSQHLSLDASTFEGLLAAVWVLQRHHEQAAGSHLVSDVRAAGLDETHTDPLGISERDTVNARLVLSVLSKAANGSQVSKRVRCANCDYESASQSQFCGICGAQLGEPQPIHETEPAVELKASYDEPVPPLADSFLPSLSPQADSSFVYTLEDRMNIFYWGRVLLVIVSLACVAAAVSYWYRDLRDVAAKLSQPKSARVVSIIRPATGMTTPGNRTPADYKMRSLAEDIRHLLKPSAGIPLDSLPRAAPHRVRRISVARRTASGTRKLARRNYRHASRNVRARAVTRAAAPATVARYGKSRHDSENQMARAAQNVMDQDQETRSDQDMQGLADDGEGKGAPVATRHYVPRPPPGFGNLAARAGRYIPRPPPGGAAASYEPGAGESRSNDRQMPMNRVPRPPQR